MASKLPVSNLSDEADESCEDDDDYYDYNESEAYLEPAQEKFDLESFQYKELGLEEVERLLNESVESLCKLIDLPPTIARLLLHTNQWKVDEVRTKFLSDPWDVLAKLHIIPPPGTTITPTDSRAATSAVQLARRLGATIVIRPFQICQQSLPVCDICFTSPSPSSSMLDLSGDVATPTSGPHSDASPIPSNTSLISSDSLPKNNASITPAIGRLYGLSCGHRFCVNCWRSYLTVQIEQGLSTTITCMASDCNLLVVEDFLLVLITGSPIKDKYLDFVFRLMIESHPSLRNCAGANCSVVISALEPPKARRVHCQQCQAEFCFLCGKDYHAPADCETIKKWLLKCRDDSSTAKYMAANTKDCPKCHVCIEKNGGCNHMQCTKCKYDFCWVCMGAWVEHEGQYYVCSRYREKPMLVQESVRNRARESLKRYLFYYERWENHERSLRLEQQQRERIQTRIHQKVMNKEGTWIDWQYLLAAADTLRNCRYTLKYTYPYAYFPNTLQRKELFEYQQGLLEAEVEDLSWKIEHAEITDRGDLQNKMDVCEKRRLTLLQEFLDN